MKVQLCENELRILAEILVQHRIIIGQLLDSGCVIKTKDYPLSNLYHVKEFIKEVSSKNLRRSGAEKT